MVHQSVLTGLKETTTVLFPHQHIEKLSVPQACSSSERNYVFKNAEIEEVQVKWEQYCKVLQTQSK